MGKSKNKIIYYITISDIQEVADQILDRNLTPDELKLVQGRVGEYIDWYNAIELVVNEKIQSNEIIINRENAHDDD